MTVRRHQRETHVTRDRREGRDARRQRLANEALTQEQRQANEILVEEWRVHKKVDRWAQGALRKLAEIFREPVPTNREALIAAGLVTPRQS